MKFDMLGQAPNTTFFISKMRNARASPSRVFLGANLMSLIQTWSHEIHKVLKLSANIRSVRVSTAGTQENTSRSSILTRNSPFLNQQGLHWATNHRHTAITSRIIGDEVLVSGSAKKSKQTYPATATTTAAAATSTATTTTTTSCAGSTAATRGATASERPLSQDRQKVIDGFQYCGETIDGRLTDAQPPPKPPSTTAPPYAAHPPMP